MTHENNQGISSVAHGGKRIGAGRPAGSLTGRTREIAERATAEGKTPLEIMLENMRHFQQVALDAEAVIEGLSAEEFFGLTMEPEEQFKMLLAQVKQAAGLRQMAHECARDAARFIHPTLASVQHSGEIGVRRASEFSDDELAAIAGSSGERASEAPVDPTKLN
jgi:hypothetical protein